METQIPPADVVMLGTFSAWNLGTIQARALPLATELNALGVRSAIVVTPWDMLAEAGVIDVIDGVPIINTSAVSANRPISPVRQQIQWVRKLTPRIVHVFKPKGFGGFAGQLLARSMPLVVDSDDWEGDGGWNESGQYNILQRRVFNAQEQDLLKRADFVTAASSVLALRTREMRPGAEATVTRLPNGLTRLRWQELAGARFDVPSSINPPVVLLYSRFAEFGPDWLLSFVHALADATERQIIVRVVGDTKNQIRPPVSVRSVETDILGYVSWPAVPGLLGSSTIAVFPYVDTRITRSKQSVKLLEQMAAGCPVVASDVGDISLTLGDAGIALPHADPVEFAHCVVALLDQPERLDTMHRAGTERVRVDFLFENLAHDLLEVYRRAGLQR